MAFRNISFFGAATERKQIRENVIWFLRDQLLTLGAYYNITSGVVGPDGYDLSKLRPSYQPEYSGTSKFRFWKGLSNHWVWESGINLTFTGGSQPIQISGIYVNGSYIPSAATGIYAHYVDYLRGGVVFTNPVHSGTEVRCYRTERAAFVYESDSNELRKINLDHLRIIESLKYPVSSGFDTVSPEYKAFLPAIFVDVKYDDSDPYELGDSLQFKRYKLIFDVVAENGDTFDIMQDVCTNLETQSTRFFDLNQVNENSKYPLDYLGRKRSGALMRTALMANYHWRQVRFLEDAQESPYANILPVRRGKVSLSLELVL